MPKEKEDENMWRVSWGLDRGSYQNKKRCGCPSLSQVQMSHEATCWGWLYKFAWIFPPTFRPLELLEGIEHLGGWQEMHPCEECEGLFQVEFLLSQVTGCWPRCAAPFHSWPASVCLRHAGGCSNHMPCQDLLIHGEECKDIKSLQILEGEGPAFWGYQKI